MNWLIIQSDGEHKGQDDWEPNWFMRECYAIQHAIKSNGDHADIWGLRHANFAQTPDFESYDGLFILENYEPEWLPDFSSIKKPLKVQWIIDLHWQSADAYLPISRWCDVVLHSTRHLIEGYSKLVKAEHIWFPNGVDDRYFHCRHQHAGEPEYPMLFIGGTPPSRKAYLDQLAQHNAIVYKYGVTGMAYITEMLKAHVLWNMPINGDVNYRNFEVIGLGGCLLTQEHPELIDLGFSHGENCLMWRTLQDCLEVYHQISANPRSLARLGMKASAFSKRHSYVKRYQNLHHQLRQKRLVPAWPGEIG